MRYRERETRKIDDSYRSPLSEAAACFGDPYIRQLTTCAKDPASACSRGRLSCFEAQPAPLLAQISEYTMEIKPILSEVFSRRSLSLLSGLLMMTIAGTYVSATDNNFFLS